MSLIKKINKSIDASITDFCSAIATKFDLDKDELVKLWHENDGSKKSKIVKKRSSFVNYSAQIRSVILEENPELTFGEISKETSKRWKLLSDEEKEQYKSNVGDSLVAQVSTTKKSKASKTAKDSNDLNSKKVAELKAMCKDKGLPVKGTKQELIHRLTEKLSSEDNSDTVSSVGSSNASENGSDISSLSGGSDEVSQGAQDNESESEAENPEVNYSDMTLVKLRELCKEKGIPTKGNKNELIHRLMA
jgi:hypothetical protein